MLTFDSIYKNLCIICFPAVSKGTVSRLCCWLCVIESYDGQVGTKQLFCAGGYDWWGSLWQCRKLMSQNHDSSCREITQHKKKAQCDIFNTKQMQRERHADWLKMRHQREELMSLLSFNTNSFLEHTFHLNRAQTTDWNWSLAHIEINNWKYVAFK